MGGSGEAALHEIAAGGRFPVDHFPREENAGELFQHQRVVDFTPTDATGGGDRLVERPRAGERDEAVFHFAGQGIGVSPGFPREDGVGGFTEFPAGAGLVEEIPAHRLHLRDELFVGESRFEIDGDGGLRHGAEGGAELVNRAAFKAVAGDHQFADGGDFSGADVEVFQRLALGGGEDLGRPFVFPTAVRRGEWVVGDAEGFENRGPRSIGTGFRPRAPAESEDDGVGGGDVAVFKSESPGRVERDQAVVHFETHAQPAQALDPAAEQRRGFKRSRVNAPAGGLESFHAEVGRPRAEGDGIKAGDEFLPDFRGLVRAGVAADEAVERLAVGEIEPAFPSDEEFPADRALAIVKRDLKPGRSSDFRHAETRRAAADDGELGMDGHGREASRSFIGVNGGFNRWVILLILQFPRAVPSLSVGQ